MALVAAGSLNGVKVRGTTFRCFAKKITKACSRCSNALIDYLDKNTSGHWRAYLHQVAVLGGKVNPLLALTAAVLGVVLNDPLDGLADETGAAGDEDNRLGRRHVVMCDVLREGRWDDE